MKKRLISFLLATALMVSGIILPANSNTLKTVAKEPDSFATSTMDFELKYVDQAPTPSPSTYKRAQATTYFSGSAEAKDFLTDCSTDYAFLELEKRTNASALQTLYQKIKTALLDAYLTDKSVSLQHIGPPNDGYDLYILETISYAGLDVKENELMEVYQRVLSDHPLFFFTAGTIFYSSSDIFIIMEDDFVSGSVRQSYISQISDMIHSFELTVEGAKGNYDLAQKVQDRIIDEADYAYVNNGHGLIPVSTPFTHNIVGYVKDGKVVCDGYTMNLSSKSRQ